MQERKREAAATHIQRISRGYVARKPPASAGISRSAPPSPLSSKKDGETTNHLDENTGVAAGYSAATKDEADTAEDAKENASSFGTHNVLDLPTQGREGGGDLVLAENHEVECARAPPSQGRSPHQKDRSLATETPKQEQEEPSAGAEFSTTEKSTRTKAARKIQVL